MQPLDLEEVRHNNAEKSVLIHKRKQSIQKLHQ